MTGTEIFIVGFLSGVVAHMFVKAGFHAYMDHHMKKGDSHGR